MLILPYVDFGAVDQVRSKLAGSMVDATTGRMRAEPLANIVAALKPEACRYQVRFRRGTGPNMDGKAG